MSNTIWYDVNIRKKIGKSDDKYGQTGCGSIEKYNEKYSKFRQNAIKENENFPRAISTTSKIQQLSSGSGCQREKRPSSDSQGRCEGHWKANRVVVREIGLEKTTDVDRGKNS